MISISLTLDILNDKATRGGINLQLGLAAIRGDIIPAGTSTVYDQTVREKLKRPFLHVRYRASQTDDRRMKTWVTGSVGAATSALDAMQIHFLSERCLVTQGANNFHVNEVITIILMITRVFGLG